MSNVTADFREFASINSFKEKNIHRLTNLGFVNGIEWVSMEKIHGANYSFITDGVEIVPAKRTSVLPPTENFYNANSVFEKYSDDVLELYRKIHQENPNVTTIQVFGELFGGFYPNYKSSIPSVQKYIWYNPIIDYLVFDIKINERTNDSHGSWYLSQDEIDKYMANLPKLKGVPVISRGKLTDIIQPEINFVTTIPALYNLEPVENNLAEGLIYKSNTRHSAGLSRPIIKHKHDKFAEVLVKKKNQVQTENEVNLNPTEERIKKELVESAMLYCTNNRFTNLLSKIGLDEKLDKITGMYVSDVMADFKKDLEDDQDTASVLQKHRKFVSQEIKNNLILNNQISTWLGNFISEKSIYC